MLVTVVTPSLNGIEYLKACIDSVEAQNSRNVRVEHIFVDGGSSDGTPEYAAERGCTVLTREERNLTFGLNKGFRNASGTLVGHLGCDDMLLPGALDAVVRKYGEDELPWLMGDCLWIDRNGRSRGRQPAPPARSAVEVLASLHWSPFPALSTYFRRDFVYDLNCFNVDFYYAADFELYLRARQASRYSRIPKALAAQRRHGGNTSMERSDVHDQEIRSLNQVYGPSHRWQRSLYRSGLRVYLNGSRPKWFVSKRIDAQRAFTENE